MYFYFHNDFGYKENASGFLPKLIMADILSLRCWKFNAMNYFNKRDGSGYRPKA
jgi:hypothetical protein